MKKIIFSGMLVLICCLLGEVGTVEGKTVDIAGQCVEMSVSIGESISPEDVCLRAGRGHCRNYAGALNVCPNNVCAGGCTGYPGIADCNDNVVSLLNGNSARVVGTLECDATKTWGTIPQPDNVPDDFEQSIKNTTDWILGFVGMIAVLMLIWGGINYLTSAGDEDKARTGKKTIAYAIIGLVIAGIAYALVDVIITVIL